jgi:hypothetical protein
MKNGPTKFLDLKAVNARHAAELKAEYAARMGVRAITSGRLLF